MSSIARIQKDINNIQVFIRIKPFSLNQPQDQCCIDKINQKQITLLQKQNGQAPSFIFDGIFNIDSTQQQVYQQVKQNIIDNAFQGINGTIFHYGQTTAGKTYTCLGKDLRDTKQRGILPRIINQILQRCKTKPKNVQCKITFSTIEIYNQKIKDLLDPTKNDMKIRQDKNRGIFLQGLIEKYILSLQDANFFISKAIENKNIWHTHMGTASSRSHVLYMITLHQHDVYTGEARAAKITIVDLAGSQKISKTDGKAFINQTKRISTSLCTLGIIINILGQGKKNVHIPYRDSKLTRLLQQSLGGNSVTKLIINISPAMVNESQTLCSLRFGSWAKVIKNKPRRNKQFTVPQLLKLLNKYEKKIKILTDVIKQIMKEKGKPHLSLKQIIKMYLPNISISDQTYQNQQQDMTRSIVNSVLSRRMQGKYQSQQNNNMNIHTKSFSGEFKFNRRDNLINLKSRQKIVPAIQKINQFRLNLVPKPTKQSLIFQRCSDVLNSFFQPKVQISQLQARKHNRTNKTQLKINSQIIYNNQSYNQSQTLEPKSTFLQHDQSNQISNLNYLQNQFDKNHLLHLNSPQVKSMLGPICALHSKVLEFSISCLNYTSQQVNHRQNSNNRDSKIDSQYRINDKQNMPQFQPNSIQFNIEKIRYNLRKLNKIRKSQIN